MKKKFSENNVSISIDNCVINVNLEQLNIIEEHKWKYTPQLYEYPYYVKNGKDIQITELLFGLYVHIEFKDKNKYNLHSDNIILKYIKHSANSFVEKNYNVIDYIQGHVSKSILYNPCWVILENDIQYYLIYCEINVLIKLTVDEYNKFKKFNDDSPRQRTWFYTNSKGEHILSRITNISTNIRHVLYSFSTNNIIKIPNDDIIDDSIPTENVSVINNSISKQEKTDIFNQKMIDFAEAIETKYDIIETIPGHIVTHGHKAGQEFNRRWKVKDENDNILYLMYCEPGCLIQLCKKSLLKIREFRKKQTDGKKITWYIGDNGYVYCRLNLMIHQVIMNYYGNGKGTSDMSVDHIDRNPLNNMYSNLRIATREEQEQNSKGIMDGTKRNRKQSAKPLPEGITQDMMEKYVVYYKECYNKEQNLYREYFKIEKHPKLDKPWITTKSNKVSILDKLKAVNDKAKELQI
jgi:hypothetical protein